VNCLVVPTAIVEFAGVTTSPTKVAPVTVRDAVPLTDPELALMVAMPEPTAATIPDALMLAMDEDEVNQLTFVSNWVLPSSKLPSAVNCNEVPAATV